MKWEDEGFASEEAYNKHQQTIKDLELNNEKLTGQVDEKQKVIDGNRTKISELTVKEKELAQIKTDQEEAEKKRKEAEEAVRIAKEKALDTPEKIKEQNEKRIAALPKEKREELKKEYQETTPEQKVILADPAKMTAYLDLKLGTPAETQPNPFEVIVTKQDDIQSQVARAFNMVDRKGVVATERAGSGFNPTDAVKTQQQKEEQTIEKARQNLLG